MSFFIETESGYTHVWYVGNPDDRPVIKSPIVLFTADGGELDYILAAIARGFLVALPAVTAYRCVWRGFLAQFLWDNIPYGCPRITEIQRAAIRLPSP